MSGTRSSQAAARAEDPPGAGGHAALARAYAGKAEDYFAAARADILDDLEPGRGLAMLEVGCGAGATLALAGARGIAGRTVGVELDPATAEAARARLGEVIVGDVERMALPLRPGSFDVLILSEVLEHLVDPWATLARLGPLLKPGGLLYASSPNVAQLAVLRMLLRGRWDLAARGPMDWTHLRWFTPATYAEMIAGAGFRPLWVRPLSPMTGRQRVANALTLGRLRHVFQAQVFAKAERLDPGAGP